MFGTDIQEGVILMVADSGFPQEFRVIFTDELRAELKKRVDAYWTSVLSKV
jgi:molybdopterin-biosynthesis enzyme MoeA-like protein